MRFKKQPGPFHVVACALVVAVALLGCGPTDPKPLGSPAVPGAAPAAGIASTDSDVKIPDLQTVDLDGYNAEIARHKGKAVLVDFWATWCGPCTKQFPHTVQLHAKYSSQGLDVISMSFDEEGDEAAVRASGEPVDDRVQMREVTRRKLQFLHVWTGSKAMP